MKREEGESLVFLDHVLDIDDVFGRGFELAVTFTHARVRVRTELKCENVEMRAGIIRNQARRFSTDLDQRRCPSEERKSLTG